jgi:hypothetical protein
MIARYAVDNGLTVPQRSVLVVPLFEAVTRFCESLVIMVESRCTTALVARSVD